jgi:hypothetical protein
VALAGELIASWLPLKILPKLLFAAVKEDLFRSLFVDRPSRADGDDFSARIVWSVNHSVLSDTKAP